MTDNSSRAAKPATETIAWGEALRFWLKLGFISFGGPAGQISVMHDELVERKKWISERRFLHALNFTMLLPGPEAQQLATYLGWLMHGIVGGIVAGALFVLPSLAILITLSWIYLVYGDVPLVNGILYGIKPAVVAVVAFAAWRIGSRSLSTPLLWAIAIAAFIAIFVLRIPFPVIVVGAAIIGIVASRFAPDQFRAADAHGALGNSSARAIIDDDTPAPAHARINIPRMVTIAVIGIVIGCIAMLALARAAGMEATLTNMGVFFTKAAFVTFGGAYAVLPYVYQGGVETFSWLSATQMIDGLALGETTPGPLIMVVAFVGFLGGWNHAVFGPDSLLLAGMAGASVATFFTFLPSFLFILVGGPLVEATRGDIKFTAPLTAITAAVVGVILNLALFFAWHVIWPTGFSGSVEWFAIVLTVIAFIALYRFKTGIITTILACGIAGLLWTLAVRGL